MPKKALIIGSGFGGLSLGIRLQAMGMETTILEKLDKPGGRAYQKIQNVPGVGDFIFDMGPTVITLPSFIEELLATNKTNHGIFDNYPKEALDQIERSLDFSQSSAPQVSMIDGLSPTYSSTRETQKYLQIKEVLPFYRIFFPDGTFFDYDGDIQKTTDQIRELVDQEEADNYLKFLSEAAEVFKKGFIELGYTYFGSAKSMLEIVPDLLRLGVVRNLFSYTKKFFKSEKMRQVFSFESLLIGGSPYSVPALYCMIHFVERTWGVHYCMGGTGSLVLALVKKFEELGGTLVLNSEVKKIEILKKKAVGVVLKNGQFISADAVISNGDYAHTYNNLLSEAKPFWNSKIKTTKLTEYSVSLFVLYFGFKRDLKEDLESQLKHHNIILSNDYEAEIKDIFNKKKNNKEFSQYLHIPTLTDPSLAPKGYHTAYTLVCVPNKKGKQNWSEISEKFADKVIDFLDQKNYIKDLKKRIVTRSFINPDYFENNLNSFLGNAFGVQPLLRQSAFFRPHNRSEDFKNLYLVGANTQPGAGVPSVMMSAKITSKLIAEDYGLTTGKKII